MKLTIQSSAGFGVMLVGSIAAGYITQALAVSGKTNSKMASGYSSTTVAPKPISSIATTPTISPVSTKATNTVMTNALVHLRLGPSIATSIMIDIPQGSAVVLGAYNDSQWQQVTYQGKNGYVFKTYLTY